MNIRLIRAAVAMLFVFGLVTSAVASTPLIGILEAKNDSFQNLLRNAMEQRAKASGADTFFISAEDDSVLQMRQLSNLINSRADAIIVSYVDATLVDRMIALTTAAKIPLVFVNRMPLRSQLPMGTAFVGSDERESGTLQMEELARRANYRGNVAILIGDPTKAAAQIRTQDVEEVVAKYPNMKVVKKISANWQRSEGAETVQGWLNQGVPFNIIAANNDEMAIGAVRALEKAGKPLDTYLVGGIDGTPDGLQQLQDGKLAVSVLQDAKGQGQSAIDVALGLINGAHVDSLNWVPFRLITQDNLDQFR